MQKNSLEIIPQQIDKIENLPKNLFGDVYIAFIPGESFLNVVSAAKNIIAQGLTPIPHIPARNISNKEDLQSYLSHLDQVGVKKILAIGGSGKQIGKFSKTFDLFDTGLINQFNFEQINIVGDTSYSISFNDWIQKIKKSTNLISDNYFEIHIGIAGPAKLTTLLKYAKICGVSATYLITKNKNLELTKLINHNPNEIINKLSNYHNLHFFPFGGIKELIKWKNKNI